jgi:hypothetical protein
LRIHEADNVAVVLGDIASGDEVKIQGGTEPIHIIARERIPAGHKLALAHLERDQLIVKYGEPIGRTTRPIRMGEHVHTHNIVGLRGRMRLRDVV